MRIASLVTALALSSAACGKRAGDATERAGGQYDHEPIDIYAAVRRNVLSPRATRAARLVYVPNTLSGTVTVIDQATHAVVRTLKTGKLPQHVVPSYDLSTLWVTNNDGDTVTPIDPQTGVAGPSIPVRDPYNMYYTPDGRFAIVVAEQLGKLDFYDVRTMQRVQSLASDCKGVDHVEFTADGRYAIATCEFSGQLVKVDLRTPAVVGHLELDSDKADHAMPQDIRSSADGRTFYVADMKANGVHVVDPTAFRRIGFIATGKGAHGIIPSRDGRLLYVTNRGWNRIIGGCVGRGRVGVFYSAAVW